MMPLPLGFCHLWPSPALFPLSHWSSEPTIPHPGAHPSHGPHNPGPTPSLSWLPWAPAEPSHFRDAALKPLDLDLGTAPMLSCPLPVSLDLAIHSGAVNTSRRLGSGHEEADFVQVPGHLTDTPCPRDFLGAHCPAPARCNVAGLPIVFAGRGDGVGGGEGGKCQPALCSHPTCPLGSDSKPPPHTHF